MAAPRHAVSPLLSTPELDRANTLLARHVVDQPPSDEPPDVYLYNPLRPVPTVGGQVLFPGGNANGPEINGGRAAR